MAKAAEAFRTISEVAEELDLHKHVLRFWEVKFPQIKPMKRGGGRRYYRPADLELLRGIRHLLHADGYTIKGVQRILRERGIDAVKRVGADLAAGIKVTGLAGLGERDGDGDRETAAEPTAARAAPGAAAARGADGRAEPARARAVRSDAAVTRSGSGKTRSIARVIAELEACRAILRDGNSDAAGRDDAAQPKRAIGAAG